MWATTETITINVSSINGSGSQLNSNNYDGGAERIWEQQGVSFGGKAITQGNGDNVGMIQIQASNGVIYNTTPLPGKIVSITLNQSGTAVSSCYGGNTSRLVNSTKANYTVTGGTTVGSTSATGWTATNFSGTNYTYFAIKRGGSAAYFTSIVIEYELPSGFGIPPTLSAAHAATVDNDIKITYPKNAEWQAIADKIVTVGETTLTNTQQYAFIEGEAGAPDTLQINQGVIQSLGGSWTANFTVSVEAMSYDPTSVLQTVTHGAKHHIAITQQPAAPVTNGRVLATQPKVILQDQYNNPVKGTSQTQITATVGSGDWTLGGNSTAGTSTAAGTPGVATFENLSATSVILSAVTAKIKFHAAGLNNDILSNEFTIPAPVPVPVPVLNASVDALTGFTYNYFDGGPSAEQSFTLTGRNLVSNITLGSLYHYEISLASGSGFTNMLTITPEADGTVNQIVYVRLKAGLDAGYYQEDINYVGISKWVRCNGEVTATLAKPEITAATNVTQNSFTTNWNAVTGATEYELSVYTKEGQNATDLIISQYYEGKSNEKAIEIYNGTGATVDLSTYSIYTTTYNTSNENPTNQPEILLSGNLANGATYLIAYSSNSGTTLVDLTSHTSTGSTMLFNGNDITYLKNGNNIIDVIGVGGTDWGTDKTFIRRAEITSPNTTYTETEWEVTAINASRDAIETLGSHAMATTVLMQISNSPFTVTGATSKKITDFVGFATTYYYTVVAKAGLVVSPVSDEKNITKYPIYLPTVAGREYWYLSSPVKNSTGAFFGTDQFTAYNEATHSYAGALDSETVLASGKGYILKHTDGNVIYTAIGEMQDAEVEVPLTYTGTDNAYRGYNLVGNPYPADLDWAKVAAANSDIESTLWYNNGNDEFTTVNASGEVVPEGAANLVIPVVQGFWVRVAGDEPKTANLIFNADMSVDAGNSYGLYALSANVRQALRLNVSNGQKTDETLIYFNENALAGFDSYDSRKMSNPQAVELYTVADNKQLVINGLPAVSENLEIPLGFRTASSGIFTVNASEIANIENVILKDKAENVEFDLSAGNYEFSSEAVDNADRFSIVFRTPTSVENARTLEFLAYADGNQIVVKSNGNSETVSIYNTIGQIVATQVLNTQYSTLNTSFSAGIYLVKLGNETKKVTVK